MRRMMTEIRKGRDDELVSSGYRSRYCPWQQLGDARGRSIEAVVGSWMERLRFH